MQIKSPAARRAAFATMIVLGVVAEAIPAWLLLARQGAPLRDEAAAATPAPAGNVGAALQAGLSASIEDALAALQAGRQTEAAVAMDGAYRASQVGAHSAPGSFYTAWEQIRSARLALQQGHQDAAERHLTQAAQTITTPSETRPPFLDPARYRGAMVINQKGTVIGEVAGESGDTVDIVLGGWRNAWGFVNIGGRHVRVPARDLAYSAPRRVGRSMVALPTEVTRLAHGPSVDGR